MAVVDGLVHILSVAAAGIPHRVGVSRVPLLYSRTGLSIDNLTAPERRKAVDFIVSKSHVFSKDTFDIGRTNITEHTIDTGNKSTGQASAA